MQIAQLGSKFDRADLLFKVVKNRNLTMRTGFIGQVRIDFKFKLGGNNTFIWSNE